jgi:hypothetical protein
MDHVQMLFLKNENTDTNNFEARSYTGSPSALNGGPDIVLGWETIEIEENNKKVFEAYPFAKVLPSASPLINYDDPYDDPCDNHRFFKQKQTVSGKNQIIALNLIFVFIALILVWYLSLISSEKTTNFHHLRGSQNNNIILTSDYNNNDNNQVNVAGVVVIVIMSYVKR